MLDPIRLFFRARHRPWCTVFDSRSSFPLNRATNTRAMATSTSALTGADMLAMQRWAVVGDALNEQVRIIGTLSAITRVMTVLSVVVSRDKSSLPQCLICLGPCSQPLIFAGVPY